MAALLRRASSPPLIPTAVRSHGSRLYSLISIALSPPGSSSSPIPLGIRSLAAYSSVHLHNRLFTSRFLPFSTSSAKDHASLIESIVRKCCPFPEYTPQPLLPIPAGFPFKVINTLDNLKLVRQDKDESFEVSVDLKSAEQLQGNQCFTMYITIQRGYLKMKFEVIAGHNTLLIMYANMSEPRNHLRCFDEFLNSKGINKGMIGGLCSLFGKTSTKRVDACN